MDRRGRLLFHHEHAKAVQHPVPRHDCRIAPADHRLGDGLATGRDKTPAERIAKHRRVVGDIGGAPLPKDQPLGFDSRPVGLRQRDAWLEQRDHSFVTLLLIPAETAYSC
jgi:hypothetical protein